MYVLIFFFAKLNLALGISWHIAVHFFDVFVVFVLKFFFVNMDWFNTVQVIVSKAVALTGWNEIIEGSGDDNLIYGYYYIQIYEFFFLWCNNSLSRFRNFETENWK